MKGRRYSLAPMHDLAFVFAGFVVGVIVGLTGVGGGSLMRPIIFFLFGLFR